MLKEFVKLPSQIYKNDKNWVPPLNSEIKRILDIRHNPYFINKKLQLYNCYKNKIIIARIALIIPSYNDSASLRSAQFGFLESLNDRGAVNELFNYIENECKKYKIEVLEGPFNPNYYSELGMQASNFGTKQSFFQTYNP